MDKIGRSAGYWLLLLVTGLAFEGVALFYQHVLEEMPCVLCIHVRIWVLALILVSLAALWMRRYRPANLFAHVLTFLIALGLLERSYQLLGTERGFTFGFTFSDCGFDLGMPSWFAIDVWFPQMFKVQTSCGYTPELLFGITMAEVLMVSSVLLLILSAVMVIAALKNIKSTR
jgi:disulfide bond formation protein DsbB